MRGNIAPLLAFRALLFASPSFAGYYEVTYSGGSYTFTTPYGSNTYGYSLNSQGKWGCFGSWQITGSSGTVTGNASGTITATFTWHPDYVGEPTPQCVIVQQVASTQWSVGGTNFASGGGDRNHGVSSPEILTTNDSSGPNGGVISVIGYSVRMNPGTTFTETANPNANASASCRPEFAVANVGLTVSYQASAAGVEVLLSGGIGEQHEKRYLIGQRVTATLSIPFGLTLTSINWSVNGGSPFKSWTADQTSTTFTDFVGISETGSELFFTVRSRTILSPLAARRI